jgi:hypothetical protein
MFIGTCKILETVFRYGDLIMDKQFQKSRCNLLNLHVEYLGG